MILCGDVANLGCHCPLGDSTHTGMWSALTRLVVSKKKKKRGPGFVRKLYGVGQR